MPRSTTGPLNVPDSTISSATVAPCEKPTTTSHAWSFARSAATRARAGTDTSGVSGAPAMPGSVVANRRTPDRAGSAATSSKDRAAIAPPGSSSTDRAASAGPKARISQDSLMDTSNTPGSMSTTVPGRVSMTHMGGPETPAEAPAMYEAQGLTPVGTHLSMSAREAVAAAARCACTEETTTDPSPTAEATRFTDPRRTSPTAKTPAHRGLERAWGLRCATRRAGRPRR